MPRAFRHGVTALWVVTTNNHSMSGTGGDSAQSTSEKGRQTTGGSSGNPAGPSSLSGTVPSARLGRGGPKKSKFTPNVSVPRRKPQAETVDTFLSSRPTPKLPSGQSSRGRGRGRDGRGRGGGSGRGRDLGRGRGGSKPIVKSESSGVFGSGPPGSDGTTSKATDDVKVKEEPVDVQMSDEDEDDDVEQPMSLPFTKRVTSMSSTASSRYQNLTSPVPAEVDDDQCPTKQIASLLTNPAQMSRGDLFFLQLPYNMPMVRETEDTRAPPAVDVTNIDDDMLETYNYANELKEAGEGLIGSFIVYKSGKVKLKVGDVICDVLPGTECTFHQHVIAIDEEEKQASILGDVTKRLVVVPDLEAMLDQEGK